MSDAAAAGKKLTSEMLHQAIGAFKEFSAEHAEDRARILRQSQYFLVTSGDAAQFAPMRRVIAWLRDTPFGQNGGRGENRKKLEPVLASLGWRAVRQGDPEFETIWENYEKTCLYAGGPPANCIGDQPRTGRIFWLAPAS